MPPALKAAFGGEVSLGTLGGWLQIELYSYLPLLLAIYAAIDVAELMREGARIGPDAAALVVFVVGLLAAASLAFSGRDLRL